MKTATYVGTVLAATMISAIAFAQQGGGGGRIGFQRGLDDPAKQAAAWAMEVKGVAHNLKLESGVEEKLAAAYAEARKAHGDAMMKLRESASAGGGPEMFQQAQGITEENRAKLDAAIGKILSGDQKSKAMASLGTFDGRWDRMADVVVGFQLSEDNLFAALTLIETYVVDADKARSEAMAAMDFEGARTATQELKAKLDTALKDVLSADQLAAWTEATAFRGRGGGGGPRGQN